MNKILTTLCYLEKDGRYLMLHRTKKKNGMLYLDMLNNLERIADHANNLAESVDHKGDPDRLLW